MNSVISMGTTMEILGWQKNTLGELDHRKVKAPYVRLQSVKKGENGDIVYQFDLRITQPNTEYLTPDVMHSFEHFLLKGFKEHAKDHFLCVAPMGCQTGFYLLMLNEGRASVLLSLYEKILQSILTIQEVPYANIIECGHYTNHTLQKSQLLAKKLLQQKSEWKIVL